MFVVRLEVKRSFSNVGSQFHQSGDELLLFILEICSHKLLKGLHLFITHVDGAPIGPAISGSK